MILIDAPPMIHLADARVLGRFADGVILVIRAGQTTPDKKFSLSEVECLASCGTAPMLQVNDDYVENLTPESTIELLDRLARE